MFIPIPMFLGPLSMLGLKSLMSGANGQFASKPPCNAQPEPCNTKPWGNTVKLEGKITYGH
ncbi:Uncharacterised protein [Pseudomonas fluorescens]|uniref:Uncharacterized protein n=1 Tax=Pseudomonas fluorescens TaxID=294 RepID=A0A379I9Q8_PSEFL|nr:hypothetical protein HZ99_24050 [Pseudomonas fluorescens]SUD29441.1 Uncharacterised protein [Pseudomonas fluorescens]